MRLISLLVFWLGLALGAGSASAETLEALMAKLPAGSYSDRADVVMEIGATGDDRAAAVLNALNDGALAARKSDGAIVRVEGRGSSAMAFDPLTGAALGPVEPRSTDAIKVNNSLRRAVRSAISTLSLLNKDPAKRMAAAAEAFRTPDPEQLDAIKAALAVEADPAVRAAMIEAQAAATLGSDADSAAQVAAIEIVAKHGGGDALKILTQIQSADDPAVAEAAQAAVEKIQRSQAMWNQLQNVWFGLSLGSVLLLAAVGLAITFGVMGVINMAHGELIMLGAYTTFVTQEVIRTNFPGLFDWSLAIAAPLAFVVAGGVGVLIERGIVRFLYGRPLETLLATWGVSLILQQTVRTIFGPSNREVGNPSWMSGSFQFHEMLITWNRFYIIIFALLVFAGLLLLLKRTPFGLQMRAVTQNRAMAAEMGIRTARVDALTFGLGAGIAGTRGRGAQPDRQRLAEPRAVLHHRQLPRRGLRRRGQPLGHLRRGLLARDRQQVPRAVGRGGAGEDPDPRLHHPLHPETPARSLPAARPSSGRLR